MATRAAMWRLLSVGIWHVAASEICITEKYRISSIKMLLLFLNMRLVIFGGRNRWGDE